jgi:hypothetical protein
MSPLQPERDSLETAEATFSCRGRSLAFSSYSIDTSNWEPDSESGRAPPRNEEMGSHRGWPTSR